MSSVLLGFPASINDPIWKNVNVFLIHLNECIFKTFFLNSFLHFSIPIIYVYKTHVLKTDNVLSIALHWNTSHFEETFFIESLLYSCLMTKLMLTIGVYCNSPAVTHYINQSKNTLLINYAAKYVWACMYTYVLFLRRIALFSVFLNFYVCLFSPSNNFSFLKRFFTLFSKQKHIKTCWLKLLNNRKPQNDLIFKWQTLITS